MSLSVQIVLLFIGAYLLGGIPFGLLVARAKGVDIRRQGSGNIGATNVGRVLGPRWGVLVFALDAAKGMASTLGAGILVTERAAASSTQRDLIWLGVGACCVLGSVAPIYLMSKIGRGGFRGGKGVAASLGALLGIYPYLTLPALVVLVAWASVLKLAGYISLGSIVAAVLLPFVFVGFAWGGGWGLDRHYPLLGLCVAFSVIVLIRHRENMARLLAGTENKIGHGMNRAA